MVLSASLASHSGRLRLNGSCDRSSFGAVAAEPDRAMRRRRAAVRSKLDAALQYWSRTATSGSQQVIVSAADGASSAVRTSAARPGFNGARHTAWNQRGRRPGERGTARVARMQLEITSISIDAIVTPTEAPDLAPDTLRATLGLPQGTPSANGVTVAVIDSGIAPSPDFGNRIAAFFDITRGALPASPSDEYGHGTHVAGLIASSGELSADGRYQGIGPRVRLVGMKVLDASGAGRTSDVIRAVELTTLLRPVLGVQIINLSLGHPIYESAARDPLVRAVETAVRAASSSSSPPATTGRGLRTMKSDSAASHRRATHFGNHCRRRRDLRHDEPGR